MSDQVRAVLDAGGDQPALAFEGRWRSWRWIKGVAADDQSASEAVLFANNAARPQPGVQLCALSELNDPASKAFEFREGEALFIGFVVRRGDEVHGFVDYCPHAGWRLSVRDSYLKTISAATSPEIASGRREGRAPFAELMQTRF